MAKCEKAFSNIPLHMCTGTLGLREKEDAGSAAVTTPRVCIGSEHSSDDDGDDDDDDPRCA
jgi:hypothetical protein